MILGFFDNRKIRHTLTSAIILFAVIIVCLVYYVTHK